MGGGLELEADLSPGAVPALWGAPPQAAAGLCPVLQVLDVRHVPDGTGLPPAPAPYQRYRLKLSDGVHAQYATLAPSLNHLARGDDLRPGSVVRLLHFFAAPDLRHVRTIVIIQLEILQTKCELIRFLSLKLYEPKELWGLQHYYVNAVSKMKQLLGAWCTLCMQ